MRLPGFSRSAPKTRKPDPPPKRNDPRLEEARQKLRASEKLRKGRASTVINQNEDDLGEAPIFRPAARNGAQLGVPNAES